MENAGNKLVVPAGSVAVVVVVATGAFSSDFSRLACCSPSPASFMRLAVSAAGSTTLVSVAGTVVVASAIVSVALSNISDKSRNLAGQFKILGQKHKRKEKHSGSICKAKRSVIG